MFSPRPLCVSGAPVQHESGHRFKVPCPLDCTPRVRGVENRLNVSSIHAHVPLIFELLPQWARSSSLVIGVQGSGGEGGIL